MWTFTTDLDAYAEAAEPFLLNDPVRNTVPLSVLADLRAGMPASGAYFGWWTSGTRLGGGQVGGVVFRTPPRPLVFGLMPVEAVPSLLEALPGGISGIVGPRELVEAAVEELGPPETVRSERLYRLAELSVPATPGRGRLATPADHEPLVEWHAAFTTELGLREGDLAEQVARRIARSELFVWETDVPVSFAGLSPESGGVCRIGPVYTPPSHRRRGYAAAVTAFASQVALAERCDEVVLFTDLANPTSNAVYQSIGYRPVADYAMVTFPD
ncbi:GNAT family N-acetyltransferase [Nonomuraea lactucae]|uniref:GNAT family N-acetyltransferase n=1 Tax=Nonomuraea lactucae TaxID=2249762 RepID=UPI000DE1BC01|nr:GNAT family N-acetyltransferase [Nonomuraea lactucae]